LDFQGIHVACLCGDNGAGKSAILDAMTWALWGRARAGTLDELIHTGQQEMEVDFHFLAGETLYRVLRQRRQGRSTILEFHLAPPQGGFLPLTGSSQAETQRKIEEVLRMDYTTFINSAFLLQGRADEFTSSDAGERKTVLGRILGLEIYDELAQAARETGRERRQKADQLGQELRRIDEETLSLPQHEEELRRAREDLADVQSQLKEFWKALETLAAARAVLAGQQRQLERLRQQEAQAREQLRRLEERMERRRRSIAGYRLTLAQEEEIERGYRALKEAAERKEEMDRRLSRIRPLESRRSQLEQAVALARRGLQDEHRRAQEELERLEALAGSLPSLAGDVQSLGGTLEELRLQQRSVAALQGQAQGAEVEAQGLLGKGQQLQREAEEMEIKLGQLTGADSHCPLCGTELGPVDKARVQDHYQQEIAKRRRQEEEARRRAQELRAQAASWLREATGLEQEVGRRRDDILRRQAQANKEMEEARRAQEALPQVREALDALRRRIEAGDYAPEAQRDLAALTEEIAALAYDDDSHADLRRRVEELALFEERQRQLAEARLSCQQEEEALKEDQGTLEETQTHWEQTRAEVEDLATGLSRQPDLDRQIGELQRSQETLTGRRDRYHQLVGALEQRVEDLHGLAQQRGGLQAQLKRVVQEREVHEELAVAFGKGGVQALLIDNALPQIEDEANRLLSRMTMGRMSVTLSTQRLTQKGEVRETLDIKIADELATRSYELFSGGEAFRVNFALRVALARLLARRHGAPLPTLIVDEGFGTQDTTGRERLIEAIQAIQDDFRCILVITHLDELKDAFPIRIEVTKTAAGSTFSVF
ncbi:MAG TPA: SMC family ATPase, partial [Dehalococcoidia bacterium]|nr:SMC family ATPase [Dehalococcoidia bacterium]